MAREFLGLNLGAWVLGVLAIGTLAFVGTGIFAATQQPAPANFNGDVTDSQFFTSSSDEPHQSEANVRTVTHTDDTAAMNGSYNFSQVGEERIVYYSADVNGLGADLKVNLQENGDSTLTSDLEVVEHAFVDSDPEGFAYTVPSGEQSGAYTHTVSGQIEDKALHFKDVWRMKSDTGSVTTADLADVTISLGQGDSNNDQTTLTYEAAEK